MKVSLVSSFDFHMCQLGFLFELFKNYEIDVFFPNDKEEYFDYYKSLYPETKITLNHPSSFSRENYDVCIKMTSNDNVISSNGIISISHLEQYSDNHNKYIVLTPWIKGGNNIFYFFPLYRGIKNKTYNKTITYLGYSLPNYIDEDTINFIREFPDYKFNFFGGYDLPQIKVFSNVTIKGRVNTHEMVNIIKESKFILTRKEPFQLTDRYSGALGHAVSHCKPMIIQKYTSDSYGLPGIVFEKEYCEVIDKIKNITDEEYETHIKYLEEFSERAFSINK